VQRLKARPEENNTSWPVWVPPIQPLDDGIQQLKKGYTGPTRVDLWGVRWHDPRPERIRHVQAQPNEHGDLVGQYEGEEVVFPDMEATLEWVLSTPVDLHLFEEQPIVKVYEDEGESWWNSIRKKYAGH